MPHVPSRHDPIAKARVPVIDMKPATQYGELVPCIDMSVDVRSENIDELLPTVQESLRDMSRDDYILCVGDPILIAAAISYAHDVNGEAKVLRWDRNRRGYDVVEVVL